MEKKMTKRDYFERIREIVANDEELVMFIDHELELLTRKNSKGGVSTAVQKERNQIAEMLIEELRKINKPITITDLIASSSRVREYTYTDGKEQKTLTNQKISAIFKSLVENGILTKVTEKKKSYFSVA